MAHHLIEFLLGLVFQLIGLAEVFVHTITILLHILVAIIKRPQWLFLNDLIQGILHWYVVKEERQGLKQVHNLLFVRLVRLIIMATLAQKTLQRFLNIIHVDLR